MVDGFLLGKKEERECSLLSGRGGAVKVVKTTLYTNLGKEDHECPFEVKEREEISDPPPRKGAYTISEGGGTPSEKKKWGMHRATNYIAEKRPRYKRGKTCATLCFASEERGEQMEP